jgi:hypothetical protein
MLNASFFVGKSLGVNNISIEKLINALMLFSILIIFFLGRSGLSIDF